MDALKKVLHPGKAKEDEIMYGQTGSSVPVEKDAGEGQYNAGVPTGSDAPELHTLPKEQKESHGILRQILNPGGEKHDEIAYGQTASTDATATGAADSSTHEKKKEHGILRQIFNPGNDKYDPDNFKGSDDVLAAPVREGEPIPGALSSGSGAQTVQSTEAAEDKSGVLRQILNPGGQKYDEIRYEPTANVASGTPQSRVPLHSDNASVLSIKSGVQGPYATNDATGTTSTTAPAHESHVGRDAALGAGAGAVAYEASKQHHLSGDYDKNTQAGLLGQTSGTSSGLASTTGTSTSTAPQQTTTAPSQSTTAPQQSTTAPSQSAYSSTAPSQSTTAGTTTGTTSGLTSSTEPTSSHHGTEAALGAGALTAGGIAASQHHNTASQDTGLSHHVYNGVADPPPTKSGHAHDFTAPRTHIVGVSEGIPPAEPVHHPHGPSYNIPSAEEEPGTSAKVYNTVTGKHSGHEYESPSQTGTSTGAERAATGTAIIGGTSTLPESSSGTTTSTGAPQTSSTAAPLSSSTGPSHTTTSATSTQHSNIGTTGGTAAAALAAQEAARRHQTQQAGFATESKSSQPEHHYGRDAAIAGGVGAAGVGAYEASKHGDSTGPASKTIGPHDSNIANVLDPRVKPNPELQKASGDATGPASSTIGPHSSNIANVVDPRVKPDPELQGATHDRSAVKDTAAAGAVGAGAYEAGKHSDTGPASRTIGPHDSNVANILDPRVKPQPELQKESTTTGPHKSDIANRLDPRVNEKQESSHTGRDAALGAGAGAAAGAGIYEAEKHHGDKSVHDTYTQPSEGVSWQPSQSTTTQPLYGTSSQPQSTATQPSTSHTGRDAALGAGAGAATGAGIYEAEKHHDKSSQPSQSTTTQTTTTTTTDSTGPHKSSLLNKLDPRVKNEDDKSHTGRDAAIAGGTGAAVGAGAYEAEKHHSQTTSGLTSKPDTANLREEYNAGEPTTTSQTQPSQHSTGTTGAATGVAGESGIERVIHEGHDIDDKHRHSHDGSKHRGPLVREDEHGHNKLHKEKKEGFLHKLLHPHKKEHEQEESATVGASSTTPETTTEQTSTTGLTSEGATTEPHTGLPLDQKLGSGAGGTDGAEQIAGYQGAGAQAADYDDIAKKNTIY